MFFMGYDSIKKALLKLSPDRSVSFDHGGFEHAWIYMLAAAGGEIVLAQFAFRCFNSLN